MRCIHLDFHTGPDIKNIGKSFNKEEFTRTVKEANVDLMTVFAKCHHGYMYYPSKVGEIHPGLDFDLLGAEIEAIHEAGAKAPIYISLGFSKKDADEHPEWREINFYTGKPRYSEGPDPYEGDPDPDSPMPETKWAFLCGHGEYGKYLDVITREVCERYDVSDGVFYDICHERTCVCDYCKKAMTERGFDCTKEADVRKYYDIAHVEMMNRLVSIVHEYSPEAPVFFNGGADMNRTCLHTCQSHYEIEDLPTAWGGYDNMPIRAKFFERYGKRFMGMTGKFHHAWGEFGGFKSPEALKYECADMVSVGASISVGDHMHPMGKLDESTYAMIGYAFDYAKKIEKYSEDTKAYTDIALWLTHYGPCDMGASKLLHIMHLEYDIVEAGDDISKYKCIILPDRVTFSDEDRAKLIEFTKRGGKLIASYESVFAELGIEKLGKSDSDLDFIGYDVDIFKTPFLSYSSAYKVKCDGEVLADCYEPYFNRTLRHFCGHKNTPYNTEKADYPALVRQGNVLYFAHPIFEAYNKSGNYVLERYMIDAIERFYDKGIVTEELPSCARVRLRRSESERFFALHVLYAPPVQRGNVYLLPDFPTLHDVCVTVKVDKTISEVISEPDGESVRFEQTGDRVKLFLPPVKNHRLFMLKY